MSKEKKGHLVFIGGYGRSGSTILDSNLAKRFHGTSLGEIRYSCSHIESKYRRCSCSEAFEDCLFWSPLINSGTLSPISTLQYFSVYGSIRLLFDSEMRSKILAFYDELFLHNVNSNLIIDSSKTGAGAFLRPYILSRILKDHYHVHFVGLYRHPASVYSSLKKGSNEVLATGNKLVVEGKSIELKNALIKILFSWSYSNIAIIVNHFAFTLNRECSQVHSIEQLSRDSVAIELRGLQPVPHPDDQDVNSLQAHFMGGNRLTKNLNNQGEALSASKASGERNGIVVTAIGVLLSPILGLLYLCRK